MNYLRNTTTSYSLINVNVFQNGSLEFPIDCSNIRTFCLKDVVLLDTVFMAFLRHFVSLENLEFSNLHLVRTQQLEPSVKIMCCSIRDINFEFSSWEIFDYLYTPDICSLRLSSSDLIAHPSITSYLTEVNDLKHLELHAVSCDIMEFFKYADYTFALKELNLVTSDYTGQINTRYDHFFQDFIAQNTSSLNSLEMKALLSPASLDFIMKRLRNLRSILLKVNYLICDTSIYYQKKPRRTVKTLTLEGSFHSIDMIVALMALYPCAKVLSFRDSYMDFNVKFLSDVLRYAALICTELNDLSLTRLIPLQPELRFEKLEILRVGYVNDWNDLVTFLKMNNTIQRLCIEHVFRQQSDHRAMEMIIDCNIMHLHMTSDSYEIKRIFEIFDIIGSGNLFTLKLTVQSCESKSYNFHFSPGNNNSITAEELKFDTNAFIIDDLVDFLDDLSEPQQDRHQFKSS
ncbi:unnamed protein product [Chironomus riparius]|uniref:Uncharacterized protein n=1 Tax=Chironomus riparius TaxID=315576 RepID=A0A9N9RZA2_9DIPT|nr:unnamed protein product [Chironomus riparius]